MIGNLYLVCYVNEIESTLNLVLTSFVTVKEKIKTSFQPLPKANFINEVRATFIYLFTYSAYSYITFFIFYSYI